MRRTFEIPPLKEGHRYRLLVHDGNHVGSGGGHIIHVNGKRLIEAKTCNSRGSGGQPKGAFITREFLEELRGGKVTIAVKTFLRFNSKYKVKPAKRTPQGKISLHIEEMKLPPMGDDLVLESATVVPMLTSEWQAHQHSDSRELQEGSGKFVHDGNFVANPKLLGEWTTIGQVPSIDEFTPGKKIRRARIGRRIFKDGGRTDSMIWIWSGDTLMDLSGYQALKMKIRNIGDEEYLFIEVGGFNTRNPVGWQSPWYVMKRRAK